MLALFAEPCDNEPESVNVLKSYVVMFVKVSANVVVVPTTTIPDGGATLVPTNWRPIAKPAGLLLVVVGGGLVAALATGNANSGVASSNPSAAPQHTRRKPCSFSFTSIEKCPFTVIGPM